MRFVVVGILVLIMPFCAINAAASTKGNEFVHVEPEAPLGWIVVDKVTANITSDDYEDIFFILTDGTNDLIVWFENVNESWKMVVLSSVPTKNHVEYGVKTRDLRLFAKGKDILYGIEGSEAISIFKWDAFKKTFIEYVPPYM